ncbi:helix-turn-helix domain-containing protein [Bdellovibrio sp. NC01]|uniref:winged helix-turn-helix transcriptional regulator n=1 Tax=Bdellovibrio sp. NC01 TaxID=2220073 RepID=UPI0011599AD0|nr:helix-turn-helix domain-containing protein [Bdellovibrio sp. NC01]QDK37544.1 transcriptional regulator [Bdellovibrio sp. NC01]
MKKSSRVKDLRPWDVCSGQDAGDVRDLLSRVGDKWSIFLIVSLSKRPDQRARFSEIEKGIPGISQRMLTTTLKSLARDGFVSREVFPEVPPRVEYELTDLGRSILIPMQGLVNWVGQNWPTVKKSRAKKDSEVEAKTVRKRQF